MGHGKDKKHNCKDPIVGVWNWKFPVTPTSNAYGNWILSKDGFIISGDSTGKERTQDYLLLLFKRQQLENGKRSDISSISYFSQM